MKKNTLIQAFLIVSLVLGGGVSTKALAQGSFIGVESSTDNHKLFSLSHLFGDFEEEEEFTIGDETSNGNAFFGKGLFGKGGSADNNNYFSNQGLLGDRNGLSFGLTLGGANSENPTQETPLGSGLIIMVAAGAGYALLKRKEEQQ